MKKDQIPKKVTAISNSLLQSLERNDNPKPFDLDFLNEKLEEVDPSGKKALEEAAKMFNE